MENDELKKRMEAVYKEISDKVDKHGFTIISTATAHENKQNTTYTYTVGLADKNLPELCVFGVGQENGMHFLNELARELLAGQKYKSGDVLRDYIDGYLMVLVDVTEENTKEFFNIANIRHPEGIKVMQLIWPDATGKFPFDEGFNKDLLPAVHRLDI